MGKSTKKSATKVDSAPAVVAPTKPLEKGKREAEKIIEKPMAAKKLKKDGIIGDIAMKNAEESSNSEPEQKVKAPANVVTLSKVAPKVESSSKDSSSDDVPECKVAAVKDEPVAAAKEDETSEESYSEEDSSDDDVSASEKIPAASIENGVAAAAKKDDSSDESYSDDDTPAAIKKPEAAAVIAAKKDDSSESVSESSDDDDVPAVNVAAVATKSTSDSDEDTHRADEDVPGAAAKQAPVAGAMKLECNDEAKQTPVAGAMKVESSDDSEDDDSEDDNSEEEPKQEKTKNQQTDVEMVDAEPTPKTPVTPIVQPSEASKTLYVGNLLYNVERADVENFFKAVGEVVDVRFAMLPDGRMKGYCHVEFASADEAKKAVDELNGQKLQGRALRLDLAKGKGEYTPQSGPERNSFPKPQGKSLYIDGLDTDEDLFKLKDALQEHFGSCGEVTRVYVPKDIKGCVKGYAYVELNGEDAFNKALKLDQSKMGKSVLTVEEAEPRPAFDGSRSRSRGRGRLGSRGRRGRDSKGCGRFGGSG